MSMLMEVLFPSGILSPYIEAYYLLSKSNQGTKGSYFPATSNSFLKFSRTSAIVSGQTTEPVIVGAESEDPTGLGVKLRAGTFYRLFDIPAQELTNRIIRLDNLLGPTASQLSEQTVGAVTPAAKIQCFEHAFLCLMKQKHLDNDFSFEQQAIALIRGMPDLPISQLADRLGYSSRQLQRKFNDFVGLSPRLYKRICRFEKAVELIQAAAQQRRINWPAIALACGYSDQAHFIREFRALAGHSPTLYLTSRQTG